MVAPPPPGYEQPPPRSAPSGAARGAVVRMDLSAGYRYALKESWGAGSFHFMLGGESGAVGISGTLDIDLGRSRVGLFFCVIDFGLELGGRVSDRVRLGVGPHFGAMMIQRSTSADPGDDMVGFLVGVMGDLSVDLVRGHKGGALLLSLRVGYDFVDPGRVYSYGHSLVGQLGLGVRL